LTKKQSMIHTATELSMTERNKVRNQLRLIMAKISSWYFNI